MRRISMIFLATSLLVGLGVAGAKAGREHGGVQGARRWEVPFEDDEDLEWAAGAVVVDGRLELSRVRALGPSVEGGGFTAVAPSPDGRLFLGTHGAILNVYDPAAGTFISLGKPVPSECPT
jgi:hypothetical protein